jgi:hypothetical protein
MERIKMRVLMAFLLAFAALCSVLAPVWGDSPSADENANQAVRETIELTHTCASDMAMLLVTKNGPSLPPGIERILPVNVDNTLAVYGERRAVDKLREEVAGLDVEPRQIQMTLKWNHVTAKQAQELGIGWLSAESRSRGSLNGLFFKGLEADFLNRLRSTQPPDMGGPVPSLLDGFTQDLFWSGAEGYPGLRLPSYAKKLTITARVNKDEAISLHVEGWVRRADKRLSPAESARFDPDKISFGTDPADRAFISDRTVKNNQEFVEGGVVFADGNGMILISRPYAAPKPSTPPLPRVQ